MTEYLCGCCKDGLNESGDDYAQLSCGHEFHYECIYETFKYNFKRTENSTTSRFRECPCCRRLDSRLVERDGYPFSVFVRERSVYVVPFSEKEHRGQGYCRFKSYVVWDGNTCNRITNNPKQLCSIHYDTEYADNGSCIVKTVANLVESYCNHSSHMTSIYTCPKDGKDYSVCISHMAKVAERGLCRHVDTTGERCTRLCYKGKEYCIDHKKAVKTATPPCKWVFKTGAKKGSVCGRSNCKAHKTS